jgi:hypothetical protein
MLLQKWQTNEIFKGIQSVGLNPQEFQFEDSGAEARLKHKWSKSCFVFAGNARQYTGHCVVGDAFDWPYETSLVPIAARILQVFHLRAYRRCQRATKYEAYRP